MRLKFETSEEAEEEVDATSNRRLRGSYALSTPSRTEGVRRLSQLGPQRAGLIFGSGDLDGYVALLVRSAASRLLPPPLLSRSRRYDAVAMSQISGEIDGSLAVNAHGNVTVDSVDGHVAIAAAGTYVNVGIGRTNPEFKLDVFGDERLTGSLVLEDGVGGPNTTVVVEDDGLWLRAPGEYLMEIGGGGGEEEGEEGEYVMGRSERAACRAKKHASPPSVARAERARSVPSEEARLSPLGCPRGASAQRAE
jgi:hypothetical protein